MLDDLREKIEDAQSRLVRLSTDINRMKEVEEAFAETDQRFADTASRVTKLTNVTEAAHHSLNEASTSLTNVARALDRIDAQTLLTAIDKQGSIVVDEVRSGNATIENAIQSKAEQASDERRTFRENVDAAFVRTQTQIVDAVATGSESTQVQIQESTADSTRYNRKHFTHIAIVSYATLIVALATIVIAVLIFLND